MLEELGDAIGIVVVVVVPALLHHLLLGVDSRERLVGGESAHREEVPLVVLSQLLNWQLQLFVSCPSV
jgi:hypothetical protein